jgi:hypothetical protein
VVDFNEVDVNVVEDDAIDDKMDDVVDDVDIIVGVQVLTAALTVIQRHHPD